DSIFILMFYCAWIIWLFCEALVVRWLVRLCKCAKFALAIIFLFLLSVGRKAKLIPFIIS
ncbi:MAG: hypothetical protein KKA81_03930, partial [Bacteroidetes bacterium]|nr:hypothetical protein [Bacteroidota bacterium]